MSSELVCESSSSKAVFFISPLLLAYEKHEITDPYTECGPLLRLADRDVTMDTYM